MEPLRERNLQTLSGRISSCFDDIEVTKPNGVCPRQKDATDVCYDFNKEFN